MKKKSYHNEQQDNPENHPYGKRTTSTYNEARPTAIDHKGYQEKGVPYRATTYPYRVRGHPNIAIKLFNTTDTKEVLTTTIAKIGRGTSDYSEGSETSLKRPKATNWSKETMWYGNTAASGDDP